HNLAYFLRIEMLSGSVDAPNLWLPSVLDYIADDIGDVQALLNKPARTV
ncbi:hypothetical protein P6U08_005087, partial [Salmonella enterica subsp. enterica serovar Rubislaw]|nr:hypothetical protein [Salmonella enterica subsp. enterica serovar Rubislaw]